MSGYGVVAAELNERVQAKELTLDEAAQRLHEHVAGLGLSVTLEGCRELVRYPGGRDSRQRRKRAPTTGEIT